MSDNPEFKSFVETLCAKGEITAQDVLHLRGQVFPDGKVSNTEATAVFRLDQNCKVKDTTWTRFYVDVLTDYFLWQSDLRGYVSDDQAAQIVHEIGKDDHVDAASELELLINISTLVHSMSGIFAAAGTGLYQRKHPQPRFCLLRNKQTASRDYAVRCGIDPQSYLCTR